MVAVVAAYRKALVNDGWAICLHSCTNGCRKSFVHLVGTPFLAFPAAFSPEERSAVLWSEGLDYLTLANEWVCPRS